MLFGNACTSAPAVAAAIGSMVDGFINDTLGPAGFAVAVAIGLAFTLREFL